MIEIPLTRGQTALVDDVDADLLSFKWYAKYNRSTKSYYAARNVGIRPFRKTLYMHTIVLERMLNRELSDKEVVDHIWHDTTDNRRSKIRVATKAQNSANQTTRSNTSLYKGVTFNKRLGRYIAQISHNRVRYHLGVFNTAEDAKEAYDKKSLELFGDFRYRKEQNIGE